MENDKKSSLNIFVYDGLLPIAFLDSHIIKSDTSDEINLRTEFIPKINKKYNQLNLPDACSSILLSKIYEIH